MNEIIKRMLDIISEHGTNAKQVTEALGISSSSFSDWKKGRGKPSFETVMHFAEYFDVSLDYIAWEKSNSSTSVPVPEVDFTHIMELLDKDIERANKKFPSEQIETISKVAKGLIINGLRHYDKELRRTMTEPPKDPQD